MRHVRKPRRRGALVVSVLVAWCAPDGSGSAYANEVAGVEQPSPAGLFRRGINIELLGIGAAQAVGPKATSGGIMLAHGAEIDLGPRLALRLTVHVAVAPGSSTLNGDSEADLFGAAFFAPGVVYRFRDSDRQKWIPYVTAAVDLGSYQFGRHLLGLEAAPAGHAQSFSRSGAAPAAGVGILFSPARLFSLRFGVDYAYFYVAHTSLHLLSETLAVRFSF
jgi:hypothetical protein